MSLFAICAMLNINKTERVKEMAKESFFSFYVNGKRTEKNAFLLSKDENNIKFSSPDFLLLPWILLCVFHFHSYRRFFFRYSCRMLWQKSSQSFALFLPPFFAWMMTMMKTCRHQQQQQLNCSRFSLGRWRVFCNNSFAVAAVVMRKTNLKLSKQTLLYERMSANVRVSFFSRWKNAQETQFHGGQIDIFPLWSKGN